MTKLNYTGRKISGEKAGQALSKDLRKRIPPGSAARAAARDPHVELDISGKQLTDQGFALFIDDLIECIEFRDAEHPHGTLQLTELSLKGNELTTTSMAKLGTVVALSAGTLTRLDISENDIAVENDTQRKEWETFLKSFQGCYVLKKIDFGGNHLGAAGFDVLARVYVQSDLDFIMSPQQENHESPADSVAKGMGELRVSDGADGQMMTNIAQGAVQNDQGVPETDIPNYACTRGLRSVPYLVFSNCCTTNACAFHLWSLIMSHRTPEQLLQFLPAGKSVAPQDIDTDKCGIIYKPYSTLGSLAQRFLDLGVRYRQNLAGSSAELEASSVNDDDSDEENIIRKREAERKAQIEMERMRIRLALDIITTDGMHIVDLWKVAFKMMVVARSLLLVKETPKTMEGEDNETPNPQQDEVNDLPPESTPLFARFTEEFPSLDVYSPKKEQDKGKGPELTPQKTGRRRRTSSRAESGRRTSSKQYNRAGAGDAIAKLTNRTGQVDCMMRFGLQAELWTDIIARAVEGSEILSEEQRIKVVLYASDWASIEQEKRITGGTESEQQRKILISMDCINYQK